MPILGPSNPFACLPVTITAQTVVNSVATDLLQRIAPEDPVLLDYVNRVQLQLLRASRWRFLLSAPQRFVTKAGITDYWVGPTGNNPVAVSDTGLNLLNLGPIKTDTVYDRSNFRPLKRVLDAPLRSQFMFRDMTARQGPPRLWKVSQDAGCVFSLFPAPDNQNIYQPVPESPLLFTTPGGALPARIYFVRVTLVDSLGNESSASLEGRVFVPGSSIVSVAPPLEIPAAASGVLYNRFNVYIFNAGSNVNTSTGQETLVNQSGPLSNGAAYTEPVTGFLTGGAAFPTANTLEAMRGYLIEFRYFQAKPQVSTLGTVLLIPGDYFDVLVAGVNYFTAAFLKDQDASMYWKGEYDTGVTGMIRDKNLFPRSPDFVSPDPTSIANTNYWGYETEPDFYLNQGSV